MPQSVLGTKTTVKNTSGGEKTFSFLPPHGRTLAEDEEVTIDGDLVNILSIQGKRKIAALQTALEAGDLDILKTPTPVFYDETDDVALTIGIDNGAVEVVEPTWESA